MPSILFITHVLMLTQSGRAARAGFSVHYPWATRTMSSDRIGLIEAAPWCGEIVHSPQHFSGYLPTFVSFSGNAGDSVSVHYTRNRVPRKRTEFEHEIVNNASIHSSGQLCLEVQLPRPSEIPEFGVMLFEAMDPKTGLIEHSCVDVKVVDLEILGIDHPAMCASNNKTLSPMPEEFVD